MNKKYIMFAVLGLFAIGMVTAMVAYYGFFTQSFNVVSAISISECNDEINGTHYGGDIIIGKECTIINNADTERIITISNDAPEDNITVSYVGTLELTKKEVIFGNESWNILNGIDNKVQIEYTIAGKDFSAKVTNEPDLLEDYVLIYYPDNDDRFINPSEAWIVDFLPEGNLPYEFDWNYGEPYMEDYDYCSTKEYKTCHGAKIWYIPIEAINENNTINWNQANKFYFESKLIQYNSDGIITLYGDSEITITPIYTIGTYVTGSYTIKTTIA